MSTAKNNNYSILPWYASLSGQYTRTLERRNIYAGLGAWPLVCAEQRLPCFQVVRTGSALEDPITRFDLVSIESGGTTNILGAMTDGGLIVESFTDYDLITYPGLSNLTDVTIGPGQYYAIMGDGTNTWYSEVFCVKQYLGDLIKLTFWHDEPFTIQDYHISYATPYYSTVYLPSVINKPRYEWEEDLEERDGYEFMLYGVSNKVFRFNVLLPEYMADALRIVPLHHYRTIVYDDIQYDVTYLKITPRDWVEQGHLIPFEFEFKTDTAVQITGKVKPESEGFSYDQAAYDDSHL